MKITNAILAAVFPFVLMSAVPKPIRAANISISVLDSLGGQKDSIVQQAPPLLSNEAFQAADIRTLQSGAGLVHTEASVFASEAHAGTSETWYSLGRVEGSLADPEGLDARALAISFYSDNLRFDGDRNFHFFGGLTQQGKAFSELFFEEIGPDPFHVSVTQNVPFDVSGTLKGGLLYFLNPDAVISLISSTPGQGAASFEFTLQVWEDGGQPVDPILPQVVPEPGSLPTFVAGLAGMVGLLGFRRRRKS
jgi:hypothetical protein